MESKEERAWTSVCVICWRTLWNDGQNSSTWPKQSGTRQTVHCLSITSYFREEKREEEEEADGDEDSKDESSDEEDEGENDEDDEEEDEDEDEETDGFKGWNLIFCL